MLLESTVTDEMESSRIEPAIEVNNKMLSLVVVVLIIM